MAESLFERNDQESRIQRLESLVATLRALIVEREPYGDAVLVIRDLSPIPDTKSSVGQIFVDSADRHTKIRHGDGTLVDLELVGGGGGVVAFDAVVDPNYTGSDGDAVTLSTGSVVYVYKTPQAMEDARGYAFPNNAAVRINRIDSALNLTLGAFTGGSLYLFGEAARGVPILDGLAVLGTLTVSDPDAPVRLDNLVLFSGLTATGNAATQGMRFQMSQGSIDEILGGFIGATSDEILRSVKVGTSWILNSTHGASDNIYARFVNVYFGGVIGSDDDTDPVIGGIYSFETCYFASSFIGNLGGFPVATDKHFIFQDCDFAVASQFFSINGGTLTLEFYNCRFGANSLVLDDAGGGGTVNLRVIGEDLPLDITGIGAVTLNRYSSTYTPADLTDWSGSADPGDLHHGLDQLADRTKTLEAAGSGAPTTADYLVGTAQAGLSAEIVVGTTPGGELGGTWASPTVDATHSGSAHHAALTIGADGEHTLAGQVLSGVAASATQVGHVELATAAETTTGTDATRAVTPDGLAGSDYGKRVVGILVSDPQGSAITTGDGKACFRVPSVMNGWNLVAVAASLSTVSSSGIPTIQLRRSRWSSATARTDADMLSTKLTIDASEFDSIDAAAAAVIDTTKDDVNTGDNIYIDIDVAGTGAKGLFVEMQYQLP